MKKLLSLPPNLVNSFHEVTGLSHEEWFCSHDPVGKKLGSGGGTAWLLLQAYREDVGDGGQLFGEWLSREKRIVLHAGGQSRRLPSYAPSGKVLTPIPVFRWERGQRLSQDLLSLQLPLYQRIMELAPEGLHTMVVSGDVYIRAPQPLQPVPDADVVCYGLWLDADIAKDHGVFMMSRTSPSLLKCMLQKPSVQELCEWQKDHLFLTDIGIWLLSDRAVELLMRRSQHSDGSGLKGYDLYGEFGCGLGTHPGVVDEELRQLRVAVLPLAGGEFYHFGTSRELLSSMLKIQNVVSDQREIMHHSRKPHPAIFVQNAFTEIDITEQNQNVWIENSWIGQGWSLAREHVVTGVPENTWRMALQAGDCIDVVPIGDRAYVLRPYSYNDSFRGDLSDPSTMYLGRAFSEWAEERHVDISKIEGCADLQSARIFPVVENLHDAQLLLRWMMHEPHLESAHRLWLESRRMSADDISNEANIERLFVQRKKFRDGCWPVLARNYEHSIFYQIDLEHAAREFVRANLPLPRPLPESAPLMTRIHDSMFRAVVCGRRNDPSAVAHEQEAFSLLRQGLTEQVLADKQNPRLSVVGDQIVWGRSPVRIDIAGGWTDTPPFCLMEGGAVLNFAIELNGQPPIQAYVKPCRNPVVVLRSIDLGVMEVIETYEQLAKFNAVGSPFSIPKAALALAGFLPGYGVETYDTLSRQLEAFGCGLEVTLLSAIPAGSGLGTSSVLAATVLGALSDFCGLAWDKNEIGRRTLILEQLLTTGGGWQDQFGGVLPGVKLLQTERGFEQSPVVRWLPTDLYTQPDYQACHLLYYTGITRTAKGILSEIVRRMFLNQCDELAVLRDMKRQAYDMFEAIQRNDFNLMGRLVRKTWVQNQTIDQGTNPDSVRRLTELIDDLCLGYKLPGAGGGGYLYMVAKDPEAAVRVKRVVEAHRFSPNARFVDMTLSNSGLQVSRS